MLSRSRGLFSFARSHCRQNSSARTYRVVTTAEQAEFQRIVGKSHVVTDADLLAQHNRDWMGKYCGSSSTVLRPSSTGEVSELLRYCNENNIAVVPQGGNTGLVGGSVPVFDETIISMSLMNKIISFDERSGVLVCEAGCILDQLHSWLEERDHIMPLDLGAKGSCQIGGNVATNAGGIRYLRYGSLHSNVLGLEVVLANGEVLDMMSTLRKDNVGYDLKQLFIGSEGTLGIITKVAIALPRKPKAVNVTLLGCSSFEAVCNTLAAAKGQLGEILSACEFMDDASMHSVLSVLPDRSNPLSSSYPFYVLIETAGSNDEHDRAKLESMLEDVMTTGDVEDGVLASSTSQAASLWALREDVSLAMTSRGPVWKYDVSLPLQHMYELVEATRERTKPFAESGAVVAGYGHLGDSNLHLNISMPTADANTEMYKALEPYVLQWTADHSGSISAEHGLGQAKHKYAHLTRSKQVLSLMKNMKTMLDPKGILNPYKVFAPPTDSQE